MIFTLRSAWRPLAILTAVLLTSALTPAAALGQNGFVAAIAYSPSTGRLGYTAAEARHEQQARDIALRRCAAPDGKVFIWAQDQWLAAAAVEGMVGTAGFARGKSPEEAQARALEECGKRAGGRAQRVILCVHSSGMRVQQLRTVAAKPVTSKTGFFAAIAYSPSTGKIGSTAGQAKTKDEAFARALKQCKAPDAKVWMWGDAWIAIAVAEDGSRAAGFGPGDDRKHAEATALAQCRKQSHGAPCKLALALYSAGEKPVTVAKPSPAAAPNTASSYEPPSAPSPPNVRP